MLDTFAETLVWFTKTSKAHPNREETMNTETADVDQAADALAQARTERDAALAELEAFRIKVRDEALRVKKENDWCDEGVNETLSRLGLDRLPQRRSFTFEVPLTAVARYSTTSYTEDEARAEVAEAIEADRERARLSRSLLYGHIKGRKVGDEITLVTE